MRWVSRFALALVVVAAGLGLQSTAGCEASGWWAPPLGNQPWQWELSHPLRLTNARDMGTRDRLPDGQLGTGPVIYDIDGIINPASTVSALHAMGKARRVLHRGRSGRATTTPPRNEGITTTYYDQLQSAGVFGTKVPGYPEYYLNIQSPVTVSIIESMIEKQCAAKGFDAVETDIDEEYTDIGGLTKADRRDLYDDAGQLHARPRARLVDQEPGRHRRQLCDRHVPAGRRRIDRAVQSVLDLWAACPRTWATRPSSTPNTGQRRSSLPPDDLRGFNGARFNVGLTGIRKPCE